MTTPPSPNAARTPHLQALCPAILASHPRTAPSVNHRRVLAGETCIDNNTMSCIVTDSDLEFVFQMLSRFDLASIAKPRPASAIGEGDIAGIVTGMVDVSGAAAGLAEEDVSGDEKLEEDYTIEKEVNV